MTTPSRATRAVAVSTTSQLLAKVLHLVLNVVSTLAIIRSMSPTGYGHYVLVLTTTMLVGLAADLGLPKLAVREIARAPETEHDILGALVAARLVLACVAAVLVQVVLACMRVPAEVHVAAGVASLLFFGDALLSVVVVFHVRVRQHYEAFIRVGMEAFETVLLLWLVARGASLAWLFVPPVVATALGGIVAVVAARRRFGARLVLAPRRLVHLVREALPVGAALLVGVAYLKLDGLVLAMLGTPREVGLYGSAYQPIEYAFLGSAVVINVVFPMLAGAWGSGDASRFADLYRRGTEVLVAAMVVVPILVWFAGEPAISMVYGLDYADATRPLQILAVALVLMTVNGWQSFVLLAGGQQRATLRYNIAALAVSVVASLALVPALGALGAALATLVTAVFVAARSTAAVARLLAVRLDRAGIARVVAAAAGLAATLALAVGLGAPWWALMPAAAVGHPAWLYLAGALAPVLAVLRRTPGDAPGPAPVIDLTEPAAGAVSGSAVPVPARPEAAR